MHRWKLAGATAQKQQLLDWKLAMHTLSRFMDAVDSLAPATTSDFKVYFGCDAKRFAVVTNQIVVMQCVV